MPKTLTALQEERSHKYLCAKDVIERVEKESRNATDDELAIINRCNEEIEKINGEIDATEKTMKAAERLAEIESQLSASKRLTKPEAPGATVTNATKVPATFKRYGPMTAFKGPDAELRAYRCGQWLRAHVFGDQRAARYCEQNGMGTVGNIRAAASEGSNTDGGFLVPEEFSQTIIDLREQYGVFRRNTRVVPMGRDTLLVPRRLSGLTIGPIGENPGSAISQSNVTWNQVRLTAKKCGGLSLMSSEIAEDAVIDLANWVAEEFAYAFALFEDQCGFIGDGTSTYMGISGLTNILTTASAKAGAVAAASGHDTFAEIDATDLATLMGKLPAYVTNPKWYCSKVAAELIFGRLQQNAGGNTIQTLDGGTVARNYLGYPIVISQVLPTATTAINGTAMLFFGDLALSSTMGDRRDVRVFPSEHRYMDTDQIGIRGTERVDIVNHDLGDGTTPGPVVGLMGTT